MNILERLKTRFDPRIVQPDELAREAHDEIERHSKNSDLQMERAIRAEAEIDRLRAALQRLLVAVTSSAIRGEDWEAEIQSARTALKQ